jgi:hypothetical protein
MRTKFPGHLILRHAVFVPELDTINREAIKLYNSVVLVYVAVATTDVRHVVCLISGRNRPFQVPVTKRTSKRRRTSSFL